MRGKSPFHLRKKVQLRQRMRNGEMRKKIIGMTWNENWVLKNKLESIYCVFCGSFRYQKEDYNISQSLIFLNNQNSHKTTVSNLAETLCQGQNPYPQPYTQPNCIQLPMTSLCWNPLIMTNILNILNNVMKEEKRKKFWAWGTNFLWKQRGK